MEGAVTYCLANKFEQGEETTDMVGKYTRSSADFSASVHVCQPPMKNQVKKALANLGIYLSESSLTALCMRTSTVESAVLYCLQNSKVYSAFEKDVDAALVNMGIKLTETSSKANYCTCTCTCSRSYFCCFSVGLGKRS